MRIDITGAVVNVQTTTPQEQGTKASRTDSPVPVQPIRDAVRQESTTTQQQEIHYVEGEKPAVNEQDVINAIEKANKLFKSYDRRLEFSVHHATKQIMVKVINTADESVIREIPSEKVLDMVAHMYEIAGIIVDEKA